MFYIGIFIFTCTVLFTMASWGILRAFVDPLSIVFVLLSNIALVIATKSMKSFIYGVKVISSSKTEIHKKKLSESIEVFSLLLKTSIGIGFIGFIIGLIALLHVLDDPTSIGPAIAVSLLTVLYSVLFATLILIPAKFLLNKIARKQK